MVAAGIGEVEHAFRLGEDGQRIGGDRHAGLGDASEQPGVLADLGCALALDRAGQRRAFRLGNDAHQRPPHASGGADNDEPHVAHVRGSLLGLRTVIAFDNDEVAFGRARAHCLGLPILH